MGTALTNLLSAPAIRGYGINGRWGTVTAVYTASQTVDPACPEGGTDVMACTQYATGVVGNAVFLCSNLTAIRAPLDPLLPVSGSVWVKRVNAEATPTWRLILVCFTDVGGSLSSTTLVTGISPPVGVWTRIWAENVPILNPAAAAGYLGLYPITTVGAIGGVSYANAAQLLQRPALPPGRRFFDGDTTEHEPDTVCAWTGTPGKSPSTWTSTRDQVGKFSKWDGAAEVPLPATTQWVGGLEVPADYVEAQTV